MVALGAVIARSPHALAAPDSPAASPAPRIVVVESRGSIADPSIDDAIAELLGRIGLTVVFREDAARGEILARVRIDHGSTSAAVLVRAARGKIPDVRRDVLRSDSLAIFRETLAHVVLGAVEPLAQASTDPVDAPPPPPPPAQPKPVLVVVPSQKEAAPPAFYSTPGRTSDGGPFISAGLRGAASLVSSDALGGWLGARVTGGWASPLRPSLTLEGRYLLPVHPTVAGIGAKVEVISVRALAQADVGITRKWGIVPVVGGGFDAITLSPRPGPAPSRSNEPSTRIDPILSAGLGVRFAILSRVELSLSGGVDFDLASRRFLVDDGPSRPVLFEAARVRPFLALGFDVIAIGKSREELAF